jgi:nucleoside-diphosphate-sugar epimerase
MNEIKGSNVKPVYEAPRSGDIVRSVADITRAEEGLGFRAVVSLKDGLEKTITSFDA